MKKVVCFCRVSSSAQDLTNQRNEVLATIKHDGYKTSEIVIVEGKESAIKLDEMERQTLNELKEVIDTNPTITDVYFYAIDRLARKVSVVLSIVDQMTAKGINLHFLNPYPMQTMRNGKEDAMGKMFLTFLSIGAEMEMKMKNERFADKRKGMRAAGQLIGGNVLYGYYRDKVSGYPMKKDEESKVVEDIFNWYVNDGLSQRQIAKRLICDGVWDAEDYKTLNSAVMKVSKIITNPAYSGRQAKQYDSKEEKTVIYPAIVDIELQDKAIQIATNNHKEKKETANIYYAKGIVKTEIDGETYSMYPIKGNCSYGILYNGMQMGVNINVCDTIAWRNAQGLFKVYQSYEKWTEPQRLEQQIKENEKKIQKLEPIFATFKQREQRVNNLYELGRYTDEEYNDRYNALMKEKQVYINERIKLENEIKRYKKMIKKQKDFKMSDIDLSTYSDEQRKELVKEMITSINVEKVGKYDYKITVIPNESMFKIGIVVPYYLYNCSGGVKRLKEIIGQKETDISNEIEIRYKQPKRIKVAKKERG